MTRRPLLLEPVERAMTWGSETWLDSTQEGGLARIAGAPEPATLKELVRLHPEVLGRWSRLLFGEGLPLFVKVLRTDFPPFVHVGFCRDVDRGEFLSWLETEQDLLRELRGALALHDEATFSTFQRAYSSWAASEAAHRWTGADIEPETIMARTILPFLPGWTEAKLAARAQALRANRAKIVSVMNEVNLRMEEGNLLLTRAGLPHSIFGLSHQTHPPDHAMEGLQVLFAQFRRRLAEGAGDDALEAAAVGAGLSSLRPWNAGAPKNEAWLPVTMDGRLVLVEPQQTSDVTYSFADFYTPFTWKGGLVFRKGDPESGLGRSSLASLLDSLLLSRTDLDSIRGRPQPRPSGPGAERAALFSLVDDPERWPFFTVREVVLEGSDGTEARWLGRHAEGAFQHVVVAEGRVRLSYPGAEPLSLTPRSPAFVPATAPGDYLLSSTGPARVLLFSVPVPQDVASRKAVPMPVPGSRPAFLEETPRPLAFGTSGLRGLVTDITDLEAYVNTKGFMRFALKNGDARPGGPVAVAGDLRPSTGRILAAVARAIRDSGLSVQHAGRIPTPALTSYAIEHGRPSVMVTGSHIPFDRNGIKFNRSGGEVLKSDEAAILAEVAEVRAEEYARAKGETPFDAQGMLGAASEKELPPVSREARDAYLRRYLGLFPARCLAGLRAGVYQHSAVGRDILVEVLGGLGAEVFPTGRSESFVALDTENVSEEQLDRLDAMARGLASAHGAVHAIVSTDGDSDRPLLAAVLRGGRTDEKGRIIRFYGGDILGLLVAHFLKAGAVAVPISSNDAVDRFFEGRGVTLAKTRIGSPYVIQAMKDLGTGGAHGRVVGWEANGGFLTGSPLDLYGGILRPLPSRDALLPLLSALLASKESGLPLEELFERLPKRESRAGLLDNFSREVALLMEKRFSPSDPEAVEVAFSDGRVTVADGSGVMRLLPLDGPLAAEMEAKRAELEGYFSHADGFGRVKRINVLDGVRVYFEGGDVAHMRPSGNAPQLRAYSNADTALRAEAIVALCLREPGGIFRRMEAALKDSPQER